MYCPSTGRAFFLTLPFWPWPEEVGATEKATANMSSSAAAVKTEILFIQTSECVGEPWCVTARRRRAPGDGRDRDAALPRKMGVRAEGHPAHALFLLGREGPR